MMAAKVLVIAISGMLIAVASDVGVGAEFYVDPDFAGQGQDGSPARPWSSIRRAETWQAINAALAKTPVTVYFSARQGHSRHGAPPGRGLGHRSLRVRAPGRQEGTSLILCPLPVP